MKKLTLLEQSVLLGILPLLGLTARAAEALVAVVGIVVIAVVLKGVAKAMRETVAPEFATPILAAIGLGLAFILYAVGPYVLPLSPGAGLYVLLLGVTPLAYVGCMGNQEAPPMMPALLSFSAVAAVLGVLRELLAFGTLFDLQLIAVDATPYAAAHLAPSAFLFVGALIVVARLLKKEAPAAESTEEAAA